MVRTKTSELPQVDEQTAADVAELFRALGDTSRVLILASLVYQQANVSSLADKVGISESAVSHQLRTLRLMRLVEAKKKGREVFYRLDDDHVATLLRHGLDHILHG